MTDYTVPIFKYRSLQYYAMGIMFAWTLFMLFSWMWLSHVIKSGTLETARIEARTAFRNDVIYRKWNAGHGGVYVPVSPTTPPNKYLQRKNRDIITRDGQVLTKVNPAYMTRQVHELVLSTYGYQSHITSLIPLRPANKPDPWETEALTRFENGTKEVSSRVSINNIPHLRLMRPLITTTSCLDCHADQGYKVGDIRGGISVSVPLTPHMAIERANITTLNLVYGFLWMAGIAGTAVFFFLLNRQVQRRRQAEAQLIQHEKIQGVVEMAGAVSHELNQPLQTILGNTEILLMDMESETPADDPMSQQNAQRIQKIQKQVKRMSETTRKLIKITSYETKEFPQGKVLDIDKSTGKPPTL